MFSYQCPSCGAFAYSSADATTVGPCPTCARPLGEADADLPVPPAAAETFKPEEQI